MRSLGALIDAVITHAPRGNYTQAGGAHTNTTNKRAGRVNKYVSVLVSGPA